MLLKIGVSVEENLCFQTWTRKVAIIIYTSVQPEEWVSAGGNDGGGDSRWRRSPAEGAARLGRK